MPFDPRNRPRPPWWPEDEPWPPERWGPGHWRRGGWGVGGPGGSDGAWGPPWRRGDRGGFARRIGCAFVLVALVLASVGVMGLQLLVAVFGLGGGVGAIATPAGVIGIVLGVVAVLLTIRILRSIARPIGELGDAAARLEQGDYSVRVAPPERGPGELRSLVAAFNGMAARLEAEDATRRRLLADVSHELRTPLAVIQGNLEALLDGVYPPDEDHVRPILDETRVLERLIDDLRTLSLAESGALPLHPEAVDPAVLLEDVASAHRARAGETGVLIEVAVPAGLPPLELDPMRIHQVLAILVDNAVRAMPDGGTIRLAAAAIPKGGLVLEVVDDGPGIPEELRDHVFERFAKSSTSRGSGLGLAIARALVEAHGGTISARSGSDAGAALSDTAGRPGTIIRIELPAGG
ncbi:MAG TPA: HAMP domain-containing sensor histidine kinase [Candidatus Binatia bacterium]|nr:HAMP domain-containing sensor histidine kinase [Candidatus Binatia bacterium]